MEQEILGLIRDRLSQIGRQKETFSIEEVSVVGVQLPRYRLFRKYPGDVDRPMCSHPEAHESPHEAEACDEASVKLRRADQYAWSLGLSSRAAMGDLGSKKISDVERKICVMSLDGLEKAVVRVRAALAVGGEFRQDACDENVLNLALMLMDFGEDEDA